jgi:hypothetical protein
MLLGGVAGVLIGRWTAEASTVTVAQQPDPSAAIADLRRAMDEGFSGLRDQIQRASRDRGSREQVNQSAGDLDRLTVAVEKLNGLLEAKGVWPAPAGRRRSGGSEPWQGPGYPSIDGMWLRVREVADNPDPKDLIELNKEFLSAHLLWSRQDVIDRYGPPSRVEGLNMGLRLFYDSTAMPGWVIGFITSDGVVTSAYTSSSHPDPARSR